MIRLGIAGTGAMALERLKYFANIADVQVSAVYSRSIEKAEKFVASKDASAHDNYHAMLDSVDAVVICLSNNLHYQFAMDAINAGKDVLVEYPLALDTVQAEQLQKAAADKNSVLMTGNTVIHEQTFKYLMEKTDCLGEIQSAASRVAFYSPEIAESWFLDSDITGSIFNAFHYHHIEYYKRLFGIPLSISAQDESMQDFVGGTMLMKHLDKKNSFIQWYLSTGNEGLMRTMWITGNKRTLTLQTFNQTQTQAFWTGVDYSPELIDDQWGIEGSCSDFISAIKGSLNHKEKLAEDIQTIRIAAAAEKSNKTGNAITI